MACACKCGARLPEGRGCLIRVRKDQNNLCQFCWLEWCQGAEGHAPIADNSYLGTYGLRNIWTGWIIGQAPELIAETPEALLRPESPRRCPGCPEQMVRRPGGWKCYHHEPPLVILEEVRLPRTAQVNAMRCIP